MAGPAPIYVHKYGGSSLAGPEALRAVAHGLVARQRAGHALVVVVSAMGKTTEGLLAQGAALADVPPRRELDMLVTAGERICMALLCIAIDACGGRAISLTGSQSGIITDSQHQGARILEIRPRRIFAALAHGQITVVAGYQGVSRDHEITTLGRGGSDTSAVALAAALGAAACEIYSDVDGVFSADPRLCPQARLLPQVDYKTMRALSEAGARVLNAEAVAFAQRAGIVIQAGRTGGDPARHSRIEPTAATVAASVGPVAVAHLAGVAYARGPWLQQAAAVIEASTACGARILATEGDGLWFDRTGMADATPGLLAARLAPFGLHVSACSWATIIGNGPMAPWVTAALDAMAAAGIQVQAIVLHAESLAVAVEQASLANAVVTLHGLVPVAAPASHQPRQRPISRGDS